MEDLLARGNLQEMVHDADVVFGTDGGSKDGWASWGIATRKNGDAVGGRWWASTTRISRPRHGPCTTFAQLCGRRDTMTATRRRRPSHSPTTKRSFHSSAGRVREIGSKEDGGDCPETYSTT